MNLAALAIVVFPILESPEGTAGIAELIDSQEEIRQLESLIGSWESNGPNASIESEFRWILEESFIEHHQKLELFGRVHNVREIIGWDGASGTLKGWIFSQNWTATSTYTRLSDEEGWSIDVVLVRRDGSTSEKHKTLSMENDVLTVNTSTAPLAELQQLEFHRVDGEK